jgi:EAL domain-containing protein (putative c-di-GMP-specific phosphodiesterase class I)
MARQGLVFPGRLSVNVSVKQLQDHDLATRLVAIVEDHGLKPDCFELEITESSMMVDPEGALHIMEQLSEAGFALAIDDFGTGYSSLSYLKRFSVGPDQDRHLLRARHAQRQGRLRDREGDHRHGRQPRA